MTTSLTIESLRFPTNEAHTQREMDDWDSLTSGFDELINEPATAANADANEIDDIVAGKARFVPDAVNDAELDSAFDAIGNELNGGEQRYAFSDTNFEQVVRRARLSICR